MTPKGRRTSDINGGTAAPPLNRRPSNNQLKQLSPVKRPPATIITTGTQLYARNHPHPGSPADASPTLLRRKPSSTGLPTARPPPPRTPALAKSALLPRPPPRVVPRAPKSSQVPPSALAEPSPPPSPPKIGHQKASQSLRDTIRQARAAKQRATPVSNGAPATASAGNGLEGFDFGTNDPFNQAILGEGGSAQVLQQRIKSARVEGRLNISNLQLKEIPAAVYRMYETAEEDLAAADDSGPKWYESVDLAKLIGADNEIAEVGDELAQQFTALSAIDVCCVGNCGRAIERVREMAG